MTALKRSSKSPRNRVPASSAPVSSAKISASFSASGTSSCKQPRREAFGHRGLADAWLADEHRVVLAPAAEHFDRALQLVGAPDQRIEQALARPLGQVDAVRRQRIAAVGGSPSSPAAGAPCRRGAGASASGVLVMPCEMYFEDVEPRDALLGEQLGGVALRLLQNRRQHVAGVAPRRAARSGRAEPRSAGRGGTPSSARARWSLPRAQLLDRLVEVRVELAPQRRQIGAARGENALAVGIMRQRVEQMLEREIRVPPRHRFAKRDVSERLQRMVRTRVRLPLTLLRLSPQRMPASRASDATLSTLVSATSHG